MKRNRLFVRSNRLDETWCYAGSTVEECKAAVGHLLESDIAAMLAGETVPEIEFTVSELDDDELTDETLAAIQL
jgi:hypothetical protein